MRLVKSLLKPLVLIVAAQAFVLATATAPSHALDKRVKLLFETAGYGAAAGFVIGAGTAAMGLGGYRNALMGASAGLYAGILLAAYVVFVPPSDDERPVPKNPYAPKRPVGPEDWRNEPQEDDDPAFRKDDTDSMFAPRPGYILSQAPRAGLLEQARAQEPAVWAPLLSVQF